MEILIVTATESEIAPLCSHFKFSFDPTAGIGRLKYREHKIDLLVTGIGMTATAYQMGKIFRSKYDVALNFGVAGSFNRNLELGEIVNVVQDHFSELGAEHANGFYKLSEIDLPGIQEVFNESKINNKVIENIPSVCGITVNTVHGNDESIRKVFDRFHPNTESMEGAAFLYACSAEKIPSAQIRAISNYVELRNKASWNMELAIENLNKKAIEIINAF